MPYSKSFKIRDIAAFKHHIQSKRKKLTMDEKWWEEKKKAFYEKDKKESGSLGFDKTEAEIEADWLEFKKVLIEENTTYFDIYDISGDEMERLFHKREEDLKTAAKITKQLKEIVEDIIISSDDADLLAKNKDRLYKLMQEYEFEGLENQISKKLYLSALTGWEIDAHIAAEDYELVK